MATRTEQAEPDRQTIQEAAAWHAQLGDEECSEDDRAAFARWLAASPANATAFDRMTEVAGRVASQGPVGRTVLSAMLGSRRRPNLAIGMFLLAGGSLIGWAASENPSIRASIADRRTSIGELASVSLASGDRLKLDTDSAADIDRGDRTIRLWRGGIMAMVRAGLAQPFIIRTDNGTAQALGSRFSVRVEGDATLVSVIEHSVRACPAQRDRTCLILGEGQSARLDRDGVHRLGDADPAAISAWSEGLLVVEERPLARILDELNRYRRHPIRYDPADLIDLRVSGTFPLTDTDRALTSLSMALPVAIDRDGTAVTVRRR